jgi:2-dehydro-3-deoxyphosphogluconate aldolase/(4S)-4-hydroxy-2-oxoglutarate aldolase
MSNFVEYMEQRPLIATVRTGKEADLRPAFEALAKGGIVLLELDYYSPRSLENISSATETYGPSICLGSTNIVNVDDATRAIDAGAAFISTPTLQPDTIALCRERSIPIFSGALTPTEVMTAHQCGADYIRIFPAQFFGPEYVRTLLSGFPFLRIVPSGGLTQQTLPDWWKSGASALVIGGNLFNDALLTLKQWATLERNARVYAETFDDVRSEWL